MRYRSAWLSLAVGLALGLVAPSSRLPPPQPPVVAIAFRGEPAASLAPTAVARLRRSPERWTATDVLLIAGARDAGLWRRLETGVMRFAKDSPDLESLGIAVLGEWTASSDAAADRRLLDAAATLPVALVAPSCRIEAAALTADCADVVARAIALAESAAAAGGFGILLALPPRGAPATGTIWVASDHLRSRPSFRFRDIDLAPMLLYLSGAALPASFDGVPALDLFSSDYLFHHPVAYQGGGQ